MAISVLSRERFVARLPRIVYEADEQYSKRYQEELGYFQRRLSMASDVVGEYTTSDTARMYIDFSKEKKQFEATPFPRRRWIRFVGLRIPISSQLLEPQ